MKIAVLDGYAVNPGDLDWSGVRSVGETAVNDYYDDDDEDTVVRRAQGADAIIVNRTRLTKSVLLRLPQLKYIGLLCTGYNMVDAETCRARGIVVSNVPGYSTQSVAQHVFALLFALTNQVAQLDAEVRRGAWTGRPCFQQSGFPIQELSGETMGIVGFGAIGKCVAKIAQAMGMNVIATSRTRQSGTDGGVKLTDLDEVLERADVLSLNCPLTNETRNLINRKTITQMKKTAILINTSRGPVINEQELAEALNEGNLRAAGVDVLAEEPAVEKSPLLKAKNCIITPHVAWATFEARKRLLKVVEENLRAFADGHPQNRVI